MKEQYLAQFQCEIDAKENRWLNAVWMGSNGEKRFADTLEEAQLYLDKMIQRGINHSKYGDTQEIGNSGLGISVEPSNILLVVNTRIRKRKVTEWEEV